MINLKTYFWNGVTQDALGFFNTGSLSINTNVILGGPGLLPAGSPDQFFTNAAYTIPYTPNVSWNISASIVYSSSLGDIAGAQTDAGVYHSGSSYQGGGLVDQSFTLSSGFAASAVPLFRPAPFQTADLGNIAFNLDASNNSFNNLLPGNSGSGLPINDFGGHTKIKVAGTASLDFYFPSLKLQGDTPALNTLGAVEQYLSGSAFPLADPSGIASTDFTATF